MSRHARIAATGRAVPPVRLTNADVEARLGEPIDEWLVENVGIRARHHMSDEQATSDLAAEATASVVQAKLGADGAGVFDLNAACAGWVTALDVGAKAIACDPRTRNVLVVGAYGMSRFIDWTDKRTCTLFADGAGAVLLTAGDRPGFLGARLAAAGEYHDALGVYSGGTRRPATLAEVTAHGPQAVRFVRRFPATFNIDRWPALVRDLLDSNGLVLDDVALFVFTQLNLRTIEATMAALGQPMARSHNVMDKWGYTGSACIPKALDDAVEHGRLSDGDHVIFCASGGGLAMAAALVRWGA